MRRRAWWYMSTVGFLAVALVSAPYVAADDRPGTSVGDAVVPEPPTPLVRAVVTPFGSSAEGYLISVVYEIPSGHHQTDNRSFFRFSLERLPAGYELTEIEYPPHSTDDGWAGETRLIAKLLPEDAAAAQSDPLPSELSFVASYQLCSDAGMCYAPGSVTVRAEPPGASSSR
ncbi:MAG: hypothetical protein ACOCZB_02520 [Spirochaetota bacterium]